MGISTKRGDSGQTSLRNGEIVDKDHPRVEAYGTLDELAVLISDAIHLQTNREHIPLLHEVMDSIFRMVRELADTENRFKFIINSDDLLKITNYIDNLELRFKLEGMVMPGSTPASAKLDLCRVVCRRAERRIVSLNREYKLSAQLLAYINRLSDLFYILAREDEFIANKIVYKKK